MIDVVAKAKFGRLASACGLEEVVVAADMGCFAFDTNLDCKSPILGVEVDAVHASAIPLASLHVSAVIGLAHVPKIANAVIPRVSVDMVDVFRWQKTILVKPCKAVSFPYATEYADPYVAATFGSSAHDLAFLPSREYRAKLVTSRIPQPRKNACIGVVMNVFFELFLSDHFCTLVKAVGVMRQPLTRWGSGCIPSRAPRLLT